MSKNIKDLWLTICRAPRAQFLVNANSRTTYGDLRRQIERACWFFDKHSLQRGDIVTIALSDELSASAIFLAALLDGLVPVMLSHETPEQRRTAIVASVDARLIIDDHAQPTPLPGRLAGLLTRKTNARVPRLPELPLDQLAYILFTSGTTAAPRGVEVTHGNIFAQLSTLIRLFSVGPGARIVNATPLAHTDGLVQGPLLAAASGATLVRPGQFKVNSLTPWLDFVRGEAVTHMIASPTLLSIMLRGAQENDYFSASRFHGILSTGGIISIDLWEAVEKKFGVRVWNVYGMTESVADALYAGDHAEMGAKGTIGRPIDCQARIAGNSDEGELELFGDNISPRYWKNPELTQATRTTDGWFRTGDIVRCTPDGSFVYIGRTSAVINQGAVRIHPEEIAEALISHPAVIEVATVGLPDPTFDEIAVTAIVVSKPVSVMQLVAHSNARLEPLKRPKRIIVVDALPHTESGKVDLSALRQIISDAHLLNISPDATQNGSIEDQILAIASHVFGASSDTLSFELLADAIPGWDSFNHLRLILEVEEVFRISLSTKEIVSISSLKVLSEIVNRHRNKKK